MDIARSIQWVTEEVVLRLGRTVHAELGTRSLCLAGGVALNCVANGRLLREGPFANIWIQPAAGDAGGALGAALAAWHGHFQKPRTVVSGSEQADGMYGGYLGPGFQAETIAAYFQKVGAKFQRLPEADVTPVVSDLLAKDAVIGWCQGRMEFGPRALGNRSIIGNPMSDKMQSKMNLKIKFRESFRPFAPAVLAEDVGHYFDLESTSPYMLVVAPVKESQHVPLPPEEAKLFGIDKLNVVRSKIPAVTHVDYTARVQTVHRETNPRFHRLISDFKKRTGCGVLVNTSFNVRGEPIVCDVEDAYRCFMRTEMDYLVVDDFLLAKAEQPHFSDREWQRDFELD